MAEKISLSGVPETMLQTVYARAKETEQRGAICDKKAVEIVKKLDYDFSLADKDTAMSSGVIARTIVLDRRVKQYLEEHPGRNNRGFRPAQGRHLFGDTQAKIRRITGRRIYL